MIIDKRDLVPGTPTLIQLKKDKPLILDGLSASYSSSFLYSSQDYTASSLAHKQKLMCPMIQVENNVELHTLVIHTSTSPPLNQMSKNNNTVSLRNNLCGPMPQRNINDNKLRSQHRCLIVQTQQFSH